MIKTTIWHHIQQSSFSKKSEDCDNRCGLSGIMGGNMPPHASAISCETGTPASIMIRPITTAELALSSGGLS